MGDKYRNIGGPHTCADGTDVGQGEVFEPSERELASFGDKFERVEQGEPDSDLPEGFPGRGALINGGVPTLAEVREHPDITEIDGIGPATAEAIESWFAEEASDEDEDSEDAGDGNESEGGEDTGGEEGGAEAGDGEGEPDSDQEV